MALLSCEFESTVLGQETAMTVVLPDRVVNPPVLYLLHGRGDDHTAWLRYTAIERYALDRGLAVVMPQVGLSYYRDEVFGRPYWTFVSRELPAVCGSMFRLAGGRAATFVAGLSMGGFGAMQLALRRPDRFAAAVSLSGALDVASATRAVRDNAGRLTSWGVAFGEHDLRGTSADLLDLLRGADAAGLPALYVDCGRDDELLEENRRFVATAREAGAAISAHEHSGGHDWGFWDAAIRRALAWLPLP